MNEFSKKYLIEGLETSPFLLRHLMKPLGPATYDRRPDPERFTLREAVAHLADMEEIWLERINNILKQEGVAIQDYDRDELAAKNNYSALDPQKSLARYEKTRTELVAVYQRLKPEQWSRHGMHSKACKLTIRDIAERLLGHDIYHLKQLAAWNEQN